PSQDFPLDSCNENLPEKRIHRNYASRPGGRPRRVFCCAHASRGQPLTSDARHRTHACRHGDADRWLQKRATIVSRLFFTMKIPTTTCGGADGPPRSAHLALPSPLWGAVGGGGPSADHRSTPTPPAFAALRRATLPTRGRVGAAFVARADSTGHREATWRWRLHSGATTSAPRVDLVLGRRRALPPPRARRADSKPRRSHRRPAPARRNAPAPGPPPAHPRGPFCCAPAKATWRCPRAPP